jgi:hypothetical protein
MEEIAQSVWHAAGQHPLMGARLTTLLRAFVENGFVDPMQLPLALLLVLSAAARLPFRALDQLQFARTRHAMAPEPPVFIIGHWRTGTTHLHNLLARSPAFGHISPIASGLPDEILTLGTWFRGWLERALPEDRHVDRVAVRPDSPQEDEIPLASMQLLSVFHAIYFPKHFQRHIDRGVFLEGCAPAEIAAWRRLVQAFAAKIALHQGKPRLLIKNPVYTARIALLRAIWPEARFVHIRRNPYEVFVSTRHYFQQLLRHLALQRFDHVDVEGFVLDTFVRIMARYDADSAALPGDRLCEVTYEQLLRTPLAVLSEIHVRLVLPGWETAQPRIEAYLASIRDYRTNRYSISTADRHRVDAAWGAHVAYWQAMTDGLRREE